MNTLPTLLFVHGTGVRETAYVSAIKLINQQAQDGCGRPIAVEGCFWGKSEGAKLSAGGASIPGYRDTGGTEPSEGDEVLALWSVLYTDAWYELRVLRNLPPVSFLPGKEPPPVLLRRSTEKLASPSQELLARLVDEGLEDFFKEAVEALLKASEFEKAIATAPHDPLEHRRAIARALVAHTLVAAEEAGRPPLTGAARDEIVLLLTTELRGYGMGIGEFLLRPVKGLALRTVTKKLVGDRGTYSDATAPMAGDILRYLANGESMRSFIRGFLSDLDGGPIVLLGHSLGGIMCVDLLVEQALAEAHTGAEITALVTVGSQAPLLYELGALPSLRPKEQLPDRFPQWLNIFDRRDLLSYVGAGVFDGRVTDIEVNNGQPFPQAHSAYWSNPQVWEAIKQVLP